MWSTRMTLSTAHTSAKAAKFLLRNKRQQPQEEHSNRALFVDRMSADGSLERKL